MRTVCSYWAVRLPSLVTTVQPSLHIWCRGLPSTRMGSTVNVWFGTIKVRSRFRTGRTAGWAWKYLPTPCPTKSETTPSLAVSAKLWIACSRHQCYQQWSQGMSSALGLLTRLANWFCVFGHSPSHRNWEPSVSDRLRCLEERIWGNFKSRQGHCIQRDCLLIRKQLLHTWGRNRSYRGNKPCQ